MNFKQEKSTPQLDMLIKPEHSSKSINVNKNNNQIAQKNHDAISRHEFSSESGKQLQDLEYSQKVHEGFLKIKRKLLKIEGQENYSEKTFDIDWSNDCVLEQYSETNQCQSGISNRE